MLMLRLAFVAMFMVISIVIFEYIVAFDVDVVGLCVDVATCVRVEAGVATCVDVGFDACIDV